MSKMRNHTVEFEILSKSVLAAISGDQTICITCTSHIYTWIRQLLVLLFIVLFCSYTWWIPYTHRDRRTWNLSILAHLMLNSEPLVITAQVFVFFVFLFKVPKDQFIYRCTIAVWSLYTKTSNAKVIICYV